jgi:hypothetical protein
VTIILAFIIGILFCLVITTEKTQSGMTDGQYLMVKILLVFIGLTALGSFAIWLLN